MAFLSIVWAFIATALDCFFGPIARSADEKRRREDEQTQRLARASDEEVRHG